MNKNIDKILEDLELMKKFDIGGWVCRNNGKTLMLSSGKCIWRAENHAKAALANHYSSLYDWQQLQGWGFKNGTELSHYMQNSGLIKVERV